MNNITVLLVFLLVLSVVLPFINGVPQKISGIIIIDDENYVYAFHKPEERLFDNHLAFFDTFPPSGIWSVLPQGEPSWADLTAQIAPELDINVIRSNKLRLYFTAMNKATNKTVIGVATASELREADYIFKALPEPILIGEFGENLSQPSLQVQANGDLTLYYYNSTTRFWGGHVSRVYLSRDGLEVIG